MLKVIDIRTFYGKVNALWDVSLRVMPKEIIALVGNNGAGKTTLLNSISGLLPLSSGTLEFFGRRIDRIPAHEIVNLGISHVPEGGKPFPDMTVLENLEMGAYVSRSWKKRKEVLDQIFQMFPVLKQRTGQLASTLSGGERQMLAMARSFMAKPILCMLDEPSYGLAPIIVEQVFEIVGSLRDQGITILIVEQNVKHALGVSDRAYVLENGRIVLEGIGKELLEKEEVKKAYLGL